MARETILKDTPNNPVEVILYFRMLWLYTLSCQGFDTFDRGLHKARCPKLFGSEAVMILGGIA